MDDILTSNLRNDIGVVQQDSKLFNLSIIENMRLASENVTEKELDDLFRKLDMFDFISSLENKYDTIIGEKGLRLSGGQRQRIAIARVLLQDSPIMIIVRPHLIWMEERKAIFMILSRKKVKTKQLYLLHIVYRLLTVLIKYWKFVIIRLLFLHNRTKIIQLGG